MSALADDLRALVSGAVDDSSETLSAHSRDFGNRIERTPRVVVTPASVAEVEAVLRYANAQRVPVCARGLAHSQGGQALCADAIILSTAGLTRYSAQGVTARAEAGVLWSELVSAFASLALTPRVLTMYTGLTVGGTLSVGGVGASSFAFGRQIDQVIALTVVTGAGERIECSPGHESALFHAVLGGLGHCAVIVEATVALRPAQPQLHGFMFAYGDWVALLADLQNAAASGYAQFLYGLTRPSDHRDGVLRGTLCIGIEGGDDGTTAAAHARELAAHAQQALPATQHALGSSHFFAVSTPWPALPKLACPWTDFYFPWERAPEMFARLTQAGLLSVLNAGDAAVIPLPTRALMGCFPMVPREQTAALLPAVSEVGRVVREEFGGEAYLSGVLPFVTETAWSAHFGSRWPELREVKRRCDPNGVLHPGLISP